MKNATGRRQLDKQELTALVASGQITLTDVIDIVIELNAIIGVGLISLGADIQKYIVDQAKEVQND